MNRYERHFYKSIVPIIGFSLMVVYVIPIFFAGAFISHYIFTLLAFCPVVWMLVSLNLTGYIKGTNWHKKKMLMVNHYDKIDEIEREAIEEKLNEEIRELKKLYK